MGYFSNGSEADDYESTYCRRCVHSDDCEVWRLHFLHNYEECNNEKSFLHDLIPRNGINNDRCRMFWPKASVAMELFDSVKELAGKVKALETKGASYAFGGYGCSEPGNQRSHATSHWTR